MFSRLWIAAGVASILAGSQPLRAEESVPAALREVAYEQRLDQAVPLDLTFRDEAGKDVRLGEYFGTRPVILSLVYYECPMLCTLVLNGMVSALRAMNLEPGKDFDIVTVSFDPREKPELAAAKKKRYLEEYKREKAPTAWHFLTGDEEQIRKLTESVGFQYKFDPKSGQFAHAAGIVVLTPNGVISRYFYGVEYTPRDLRLGLVEAGQGKIGTPVDQLMLFCFQYDASMGRYTPMIMNIVRFGGAVTVIGLLVLIFTLRRRNPRAAAMSGPAEAFAGHGTPSITKGGRRG